MMLENFVASLANGAAIYLGVGLIIFVLFMIRWCKAFDPSAKDGSWGFRLCIGPGIIILWPIILAKVLAVRRGLNIEEPAQAPIRQETFRRNHSFAFIALAIIGSMLFAVALFWPVPQVDDAPKVDSSTLLDSR